MAANNNPIFSKTVRMDWGTLITGNTTKDGTSGTTVALFTAPADGAFIHKITAIPLGTNVASVARIFANNGASQAVAANNSLIGNIGLPVTTNSEIAAQTEQEKTFNIGIEASHVIFAALATGVASGWQITVYWSEF